ILLRLGRLRNRRHLITVFLLGRGRSLGGGLAVGFRLGRGLRLVPRPSPRGRGRSLGGGLAVGFRLGSGLALVRGRCRGVRFGRLVVLGLGRGLPVRAVVGGRGGGDLGALAVHRHVGPAVGRLGVAGLPGLGRIILGGPADGLGWCLLVAGHLVDFLLGLLLHALSPFKDR